MSEYRNLLCDKLKKEFSTKKVLVIGDVMVDEYITGSVSRISPEAPVPVLDFREKIMQAGGACNVANNIRSLGACVYMMGVASDDYAGKWLLNYLKELGIDVGGIVTEEGRPTTLKTRYATKGQQLLRVDNEITAGISELTKRVMMSKLNNMIDDLDAVVISDYRKGVLEDAAFVQQIIGICNEREILISIDSKSSNIEAFKGATFVKPNNLELEAAVSIKIDSEESLERAGRAYLKKSGAKALIVTRGKNGISLFVPDKTTEQFPAKDVQVYDVCGAGDTVISTVSLCILAGLTMQEALKVANLAAGVVISKVGTVPIGIDELLESVNEE